MYAKFGAKVAWLKSNHKLPSRLNELPKSSYLAAEMDFIFLNLHEWSLPVRNPVFVMCVLLLSVLTIPALLQKIRLPGIIGLILAGALLGPHGVNLLEMGEGIKLLSKVGLLYIMFWAGLEIDMVVFIKNKHKSLIFGLLTFSFPLILGGLCTYYFLGLSKMGALLLAGMFSTHTLISYPIVNRLRISRDEAVSITVGGTVITDTLALLLLAVISGMAQGTLNIWFWVRLTISLALFSALVFGVLPRLARWFFRKVESDVTYQFVFVLAMVFVCGILAEIAGVEAIIGAFMAGLVLNRLIPHSSPLMERIEFVGNALFIPVFMFSVGMLIDLQVFFKNEKTLLTALTITSVALFTKWLAAYTTGKIVGYTKRQSRLIFGLSSSHAAATIAIILIGYEIKLFDETVLNATIFLILVTCLISSLITDRTARQIAADTHALSAHSLDGMQRILVPISNPASVPNLLDFACLIKTPGSSEPVYPLSIILDEQDVRNKIRQNQTLMEPVLLHAAENDISLTPLHRVDVSAVSGIQRAASELLATEIVLGWHPKLTASERFFGTVLDNLLEDSPEMLFVTNILQPPTGFKGLKVILPNLAQLESGFAEIIRRLENLSKRMDLGLSISCTETTANAVRNVMNQATQNRLQFLPHTPESWWQMHNLVGQDELAILVNARPQSVSHENFMTEIPDYLCQHFVERSFVMVYPGL